MGRPTKHQEAMTKQLVVRMTKSMHKDITDYAKDHDLGKMEVVRRALEEFFKH